MFTSLRGLFMDGWAAAWVLYSLVQKNPKCLELSARQKTSTISTKALFRFSPSTSYPYSFFNPSLFILCSSLRSCLLLSSARFHLPCLRRQPRTWYASPDKLKHFTSKPGENSSADAATLLLSIIYFFCQGLMLVNTTRTMPVGVGHISATLSAQVWLMTAAICRPILPVTSSRAPYLPPSSQNVCFGCFHIL